MKIAAVEELLRTGYRSATIRALELLIQSAAIVWDERRGTVFRTQLGPWIFAVAVIDADHLKLLCINEDGEMKIVSISRRAETQLPSETSILPGAHLATASCRYHP
jgi:hypothetical protein